MDEAINVGAYEKIAASIEDFFAANAADRRWRKSKGSIAALAMVEITNQVLERAFYVDENWVEFMSRRNALSVATYCGHALRDRDGKKERPGPQIELSYRALRGHEETLAKMRDADAKLHRCF